MSGLGIALYIIIVCLAITIIAVLVYLFINSAYKYLKYQDFFVKVEYFIHENIIAKDKNMSLCIGKSYHKRNVLDNMYSEHSYNTYAIHNENTGEDIISCIIYDVGNIAIVCLIENETFDRSQYIYRTLISRLYKRYNHNLYLKSLLLIVDFDDFRSNYIDRYVKPIICICETLSLNIPLYIAFDCYHNDYDVVSIFKTIPARFYVQMIGYSSPKIWDNVNVNVMMNQMMSIDTSISICMNEALLSSNNIHSNYNLFKSYKHFLSILSNMSHHTDKLLKKFVSSKKPIFRCVSCIYKLEIEGEYKYIFLSDLIHIKMSVEYNLVMLGGNIVVKSRSAIKEISIVIFMIVVSVLLAKFIITFKAYSNNLYVSAHRVQTIDYNTLNRDVIVKSINNIYRMNNVICARPKYNPFSYIESIYINIEDLRDHINYLYLRNMYKHLKATLIDKIKYEADFSSINFDLNSNIQNILNDINKQYQTLQNLTDLHNNIILEENTMMHMVNIMKKLYAIHDSEIKYEPYNAKYYLDNMSLINIGDFNINMLSENVIKYLIAEVDKLRGVKTLSEILPIIQNIVTWQDIDSALSKINALIHFVETLNLNEIHDSLTYKQVIQILNKFHAINYINNIQYEKIINVINTKIQNNFRNVRNIHNSVIGHIYKIDNDSIELSNEMSYVLNMSTKMLNSIIYKKYTVSKESNNRFILARDEYYSITNIDLVNSLFIHYNEDPLTKGNSVIEIIYKNLLSKIMYQILMISAYDIFKSVDISRLGDKHYLLHFTNNIVKNVDSVDRMIFNLSCDYEKSKEFISIVTHTFDQYINKLYSYIIRANYLREHSTVCPMCEDDNYIKQVYDVNNEELIAEKIDEHIAAFKSYMYSINEAVSIIYKYRHKILSEACVQKIEYIYSTINALQSHDDNAEKSRVGLLRSYLISSINRGPTNKDIYNQKIADSKDHIAHIYHTIYNNINMFYNKLRYNHLVNTIAEFKNKLEQYKKTYPLCESGNVIISYNKLNNIVDQAINIHKLCHSYYEIQKDGIYLRIANVFENMLNVKSVINSYHNIRIEFTNDKIMASANKVNIYISNVFDDNTETKEYSISTDKKYVDLRLFFNSELIIEYDALIRTNMQYMQYFDEYLNIDERAQICLSKPSILSIMKLYRSTNNTETIKYTFAIPVLVKSINFDKGIHETSEIMANATIYFYINNNIIKSINYLNSFIHEVSKINLKKR